MSSVIKVENLSKQYRLGQVGTGTISHDVNRWWHKIRGKEDPYLKIGDSNDRTVKGESDYVWALKEINFEVQQGEVLGIIGRNGAGKSTLLKILSRTTSPSTGSVKIKGRVASLLEVGTGFHPELSGRDNIFLNGAILGMTRKEIQSKFDEIVDFAGVDRYIDTPVKRYSSGMYVRLAFAVAAHLEPEILIVDEVLAVGDAEFQKKCLGKMKDVSVNQGRTVLFVSHNIQAIQNLCNRVLLLNNGLKTQDGLTNYVLEKYLAVRPKETNNNLIDSENRHGSGAIKFSDVKIFNSNNQYTSELKFGEFFKVKIQIYSSIELLDCLFGISFITKDGFEIQGTSANDSLENVNFTTGFNEYECLIDPIFLTPGLYFIRGAIFSQNQVFDHMDEILSFSVLPINSANKELPQKHYVGNIYINYKWKQINTEG
jgi:lipopolysaccharide transport system ATP-binding protein